jgi:hypothetical protein
VTLLQLQDQADTLGQLEGARRRSRPGAFAWAPPQVQPILVVTGMAAEARLAFGPGVATVMAGGNPARLRNAGR